MSLMQGWSLTAVRARVTRAADTRSYASHRRWSRGYGDAAGGRTTHENLHAFQHRTARDRSDGCCSRLPVSEELHRGHAVGRARVGGGEGSQVRGERDGRPVLDRCTPLFENRRPDLGHTVRLHNCAGGRQRNGRLLRREQRQFVAAGNQQARACAEHPETKVCWSSQSCYSGKHPREMSNCNSLINLGGGSSFRRQAGYAMAALLVGISVMTLMLSIALPTWSHMVRREKEEELIFRGNQYARAIALYQRTRANAFPTSVDQLIQQRLLRKKYKDPLSPNENGEFQLSSKASCKLQVREALVQAAQEALEQAGRHPPVEQPPSALHSRPSNRPAVPSSEWSARTPAQRSARTKASRNTASGSLRAWRCRIRLVSAQVALAAAVDVAAMGEDPMAAAAHRLLVGEAGIARPHRPAAGPPSLRYAVNPANTASCSAGLIC